MRIQSTRVYTEVSKAIQNGYKVVSAQGSSRSSKTYNILIFLIAYVLQHPKTSLSIVRKTLPALKGSVFRDFKEIMQEKFKIWDNRSMNKSEMIYTLPNGSFVEFFSTDDEQKIRGRKRNVLYCNEANDISYLEWQQLVMRTTQFSIVDYNPSFTDEHWLCELNKDPRTYHFISTYKDNPFLEQTIIDEIESLQHKNKVLWTVYGLGQQAMAEGLIFPDFEIVDEFPLYAKHVAAGLDFGYSCFSGDTLITTLHGNIPIKDIKKGDFVLTRYGYKKVLNKHINGIKEVVGKKILLGNRVIEIFATDNHNFNINGKWKKYVELTKWDRLFVLSNLTGKNIVDTQTGSIQTIITTNGKRMGSTTKDCYTMRCMSFITEKFQMVKSYIILTIIRLIMTLSTLLQLLQVNIKSFTRKNWQDIKPKSRQAKFGLLNIIGMNAVKKLMKIFPMKEEFANIVEKNTPRQIHIKDFVQRNAIINGNIHHRNAISKWFANIVERHSGGINILNRNVAPINARINWQTVKDVLIFQRKFCEVYDLEVEDAHEYFANGILVHNCDPTAIVRCGLVDDRMYLDEECYRTHMLAKEIISELKRIGLFVYADSADPRLIQEIANAGIVIYPADKYKGSVMGGLTKMMEYKLCVTRRSVNLIKELKNYVYGQNKDGKFINEPVDAYNHCFVGETMIETLSGIKRIDSIKVGEYVLTSDSYRKVSKFFDNGYKKILHIRLTFDNFVVDIKATPEHKIKTTKGWKQLQELTRGDVLYTYNPLTVKSINCIRENGISLVDAKDYIVRYGNHIMVTFQRAIMFITRMRTLGIMRLKTFNWSKGLNMFGFMQKSTKKTPISFVGSKQILTTQERSQTNGTNQTKDGNGIAKWLKNKPRISSQGNLSVNGVEKNLNLNQMDQIGSVPTSVKQLSAIIRVLTTKLESVKRVARNLFATNTVVPNIAVESVAGNITQTLKKESDLTPKIKSSSVKSAVRNTTADQQGKIDIVAKNAVLNLKWKRERAKYAESNSERENIQKRGFVASNVLADITVLGESTERVYDLEVEGMHEYFANGILVHNCIDAARYYTIGKLLGKVLTNRTYTKDDLGIY